MITGEELRRITSGFVKEVYACKTEEEAKALFEKIEKFYSDNDIPPFMKKGIGAPNTMNTIKKASVKCL